MSVHTEQFVWMHPWTGGVFTGLPKPDAQVCHWCQRRRRYGRWVTVPMRYGSWTEDVWTCRTCDEEGDYE